MSLFQVIKIIIALPVIWLKVLCSATKPQSDIYALYHKWGKKVINFIGFKLSIDGELLIPKEGPVYFVSNHQGTIDPLIVVASCPLAMAFISKKENEKMPIFGRCARLIGTIHFDRDTREGNVYMLRESARRLKAKKSLLVFPEGTRSKGDIMGEFKAGALQPAYMAKATIVPITLNNAYCIDQKATKNKVLGIVYGRPIPFSEYGSIPPEEMSLKLHHIIQSKVIKKETN